VLDRTGADISVYPAGSLDDEIGPAFSAEPHH
jgi:hypothetical protein